MVMFNIKDSDKVTLADCSTSSEELVVSDRIGELEAERCHAGEKPAAVISKPISRWKAVLLFFVEKSVGQLITISVTSIVVLALGALGISKIF